MIYIMFTLVTYNGNIDSHVDVKSMKTWKYRYADGNLILCL